MTDTPLVYDLEAMSLVYNLKDSILNDHTLLNEFFIWKNSPEDFYYWYRAHNNGYTCEDKEKIFNMLAQYEKENGIK